VEAVVIDDGSPDNPLSHLGDLAHNPRVRFLQQENAGVGAARNAGVRASDGTFLNFLDADDWLAPEFCERLLAEFAKSQSLGFAYCDIHHINEDSAPQPALDAYSVGKSRRVVSGDILPSLLVGGYFPPQTVLVRRTVLDRVGLFDPALGGCADWDLWLRIAASGFPVQYVDERLVYYRLHQQSMSRDVEHMSETRLQTLRKLLREFPDVVAEALDEMRLQFDAYFQESQAWISRLTEANKFHQQQAEYWKRESERRTIKRWGWPR
jgi:glycosyltransferase involved in cell wall biosynthesis